MSPRNLTGDLGSNLIDRGILAQRFNDHLAAEQFYREALSTDPTNNRARLLLGKLFALQNRETEAAEILEQLVSEDPTNFEALSWLSGVLCTLGRNDEAINTALRALEVRADDVTTLLHLATGYFASTRFTDAAKTFMQVIRVSPDKLPAYYGLATSFLRIGQPQDARLVLRDASRVSKDAETLLKLGEVCLACDRPEETIQITDAIIQSDPTNLGAILLKARAHRIAQNESEEDIAVEIAIKLDPSNALAHTLKGRRFQALGQFEAAEEEFRKSIELNPQQGVAYYGITSGRIMTVSDLGLIETMDAVLLAGNINQDEKAHLHYALGKAFENLAEYGKAMSHFDEGNRLMRSLRMGTRRFDRDEMRDQVQRIRKVFTRKELNRNAESRPRQIEPVIVAGIMRSGTTLLEQILSRHPDIGAGGEQTFWRNIETQCVNYDLSLIDDARLQKAGDDYADLLASVAPGHRLITDKNPANRMVYGLIHLAFPDARILHMQRNPVDVAISIYTTLIRTGAPFIGDKEDIVFALKMHKELVEHWVESLPQDTLRIVQYEQLVRDRERVTRQTIECLGLKWSQACLSPEENRRTVVTPSLWQVRQPVYTSAFERWRNYEPWLGPFAELLD